MNILAVIYAQSIMKAADGTASWANNFAHAVIGVAIIFIVIGALVNRGSSTHLVKVGAKVVIALALIGGLAAWIASAATNDIQTKGSMPAAVHVDIGTGV